MKTLVMHITINQGSDSQDLCDLLQHADCVADYEITAEFGDEPENEFNKFVEQFKPIKNHFDGGVAYDGCLFETYGDELEFVRSQPANKIWTITDGEGGPSIVSGFRLVNRIGYLIAEVERETESGMIVFNV